jgi:hypothetical protein
MTAAAPGALADINVKKTRSTLAELHAVTPYPHVTVCHGSQLNACADGGQVQQDRGAAAGTAF